MKGIVLFKGGVETQEFFSVEMAKTFEKKGYQVIWFNLMFEEQSTKELEALLARTAFEYVTAFTFNFCGIAGEEGLYDHRNFWDDHDIHVYNMVIDHPLYYHKYMKFKPKKYTQISLDRNHITYMKRFFPEIDLGIRVHTEADGDDGIRTCAVADGDDGISVSAQSDDYVGSSRHIEPIRGTGRLIHTGFLPLGGTEINRDRSIIADRPFLPVEHRPIDVVFTGNYTPPESFDRFLSGMDQEYQDFYHRIVKEAIDSPDETIEEVAFRCFQEELSEAEELAGENNPSDVRADDKQEKHEMNVGNALPGMNDQNITEISDEEFKLCMPNMMFVDLSVRFHYRAAVIRAIADSGIKVHTFGAGWNLLECRHPENIIQAGSVDSQRCLDVISQSKISINVMPWFKDGAHDRIFNSMLNGALCVSDGSEYLKEIFTDEEDIAFYDLKAVDRVPDLIRRYLEDSHLLKEVVQHAYEKCAESHTWEKRTEEICELIEYDRMQEATV